MTKNYLISWDIERPHYSGLFSANNLLYDLGMSNNKYKQKHVCHYFVDESGDGVLFDRKGRLMLNRPVVSKHFILGLLEVHNPDLLNKDLDRLKRDLLNDPYFKDVPSMQPEAQKTALFFHAKDDPQEVRREVFKLLLKHEIKFSAVVKSMWAVYQYVSSRNFTDHTYRYYPNELYDFTVRRLFKEKLHKADHYVIHFAKRGSKNRSMRLIEQLRMAQERFFKEKEIRLNTQIEVKLERSFEAGGLQAVDYFLWALQRVYERNEDRFIKLIWDKVSVVQDVDDKRENQYGVYYTKKKPLIAAAIPPIGFRI